MPPAFQDLTKDFLLSAIAVCRSSQIATRIQETFNFLNPSSAEFAHPSAAESESDSSLSSAAASIFTQHDSGQFSSSRASIQTYATTASSVAKEPVVSPTGELVDTLEEQMRLDPAVLYEHGTKVQESSVLTFIADRILPENPLAATIGRTVDASSSIFTKNRSFYPRLYLMMSSIRWFVIALVFESSDWFGWNAIDSGTFALWSSQVFQILVMVYQSWFLDEIDKSGSLGVIAEWPEVCEHFFGDDFFPIALC